MPDCPCGDVRYHCLSGHHHVVPSLATGCDERLTQAEVAA